MAIRYVFTVGMHRASNGFMSHNIMSRPRSIESFIYRSTLIMNEQIRPFIRYYYIHSRNVGTVSGTNNQSCGYSPLRGNIFETKVNNRNYHRLRLSCSHNFSESESKVKRKRLLMSMSPKAKVMYAQFAKKSTEITQDDLIFRQVSTIVVMF